jgi:RNA polymerase sigma factor (sigma-70 family)
MSNGTRAAVTSLIRHLTARHATADATDADLLKRFVAAGDASAFELLLWRHERMVMGVCRRVLRNVHDAEDAFQATFLILARKARSIGTRGPLTTWLYTVAYRTALNALKGRARRRVRVGSLAQDADIPAAEVPPDLNDLLDQALSRLPERYRAPVVLCFLEGRSQAEAARLLGCAPGTVASRLDRAKKKLKGWLMGHGLALPCAGLAAGLGAAGARASSARAQVAAALGGARAVLAGADLRTAVTPGVITLAEGVTRAMLRTKLAFILTTTLGALAVCAAGLGLAGLQRPAVAGGNRVPVPAQVQDEAAIARPPAESRAGSLPAETGLGPSTLQPDTERGRLEGRFTAADTGKPLAGAKVKVLIQGLAGKASIAEAVSDAEGRYALDVPLGHCNLWGVATPAGYYTQGSGTFGPILTTVAEPRVVRDFVLQPGSPWSVELHGATLSGNKPPFFSALRDPGQNLIASGENIMVTGDAQGKAVLTIPHVGGHYRFGCGLATSPSHYEIAPANLEIDQDFDPRQVKGMVEPLAERKAVRLRDSAGRSAVVEGAEAVIQAGQAVLRFRAQPIATGSTFALRGAAIDEAGKPVAGARCTAAFTSDQGSAMSELQALTDVQGKFQMTEVLLPQSYFDPGRRITMMVVKAGFDGAQTRELDLLEVKQAGSGDFGTVVLKPGRTLRGKVVDENNRPVHGAVVTNHTNYFLYGHLQCRSDAEGRFVMPDLSFGSQKVWAQYGARGSQAEFQFAADSGPCLITVRLTPKSGIRRSATARPPAAPSMPPAPRDGAWDLTPPLKEPRYQKEPRYALLVFGAKREQRVWMVLDGATLYVDRNGNGDLTEPGKRFEPNNPKDGSNRFGNAGSHTHFDIVEFSVKAGAMGSSKFRLEHWIRAENFTPTTDFDKKWHAQWLKLRWENTTLWRLEGRGQGQTPVLFMPKPGDAQVCALDGPLTFVVKMAEQQVLQRGEAGGDLAFHIAVPGRPHRGAEQAFYNPLSTKEVSEGAHLAVEIDYPAKTAGAPPPRRKYLLKQRC